jgi:hypothetical protein
MSENMGKEAVVHPGDSPAKGGTDYPDLDYGEKRSCPLAVQAAAMIWTVLGCLIALHGSMALVVVFAISQGWGPYEGGSQFALLAGRTALLEGFQILMGAFLFHAGVQSLRGAARDTLVHGIGSILISLLSLVMAVGTYRMRVMFMAEIHGPIAAMLLAAGVLSLAGRRRYKAWII